MTVIPFAPFETWILSGLLLLFSLGVILLKQPVHAALSFLSTLLLLSVLYLELSAQFIGVMQILVYAGAILVIFMFVIVLFQDAHVQISKEKSEAPALFLVFAAAVFLLSLLLFTTQLVNLPPVPENTLEGFGTVQSLGKLLYLDFFFPFEAVIVIFLAALIGAVYLAKKEH